MIFRLMVCVIAASLCGCNNTVIRTVNAVVFRDEEAVTAGEKSPAHFVKAKRIAVGETIKTESDARMDISLLPGASIELTPDSQLKIEELKLGKDGFATAEAMRRSVRVRLLKGTLLATVQFESAPSSCSFETPEGQLTNASGGLFRIAVRDGKTRVTSVRGDFTFQPADGTSPVRLRSGYAQEWPAPLFDPFPAELELRGIREGEETRKVERKLLNLQRDMQLMPYPWR